MVFVLIIVLAIIAALMIDPANFDKTRWRTFLITAASLGIVITFMWYFFLVEQNYSVQDTIDTSERRHIEEGIVEASVADIQKNSGIIPAFCESLFPLQFGHCKYECSLNRKKLLHETTLSYRLFDTWDHYVLSKINPVSDMTYFLQWASSPHLKKQWDKQYINFNSKTQLFGDLLFKEASEIKMLTPHAYSTAAKRIFRHCRKINII